MEVEADARPGRRPLRRRGPEVGAPGRHPGRGGGHPRLVRGGLPGRGGQAPPQGRGDRGRGPPVRPADPVRPRCHPRVFRRPAGRGGRRARGRRRPGRTPGCKAGSCSPGPTCPPAGGRRRHLDRLGGGRAGAVRGGAGGPQRVRDAARQGGKRGGDARAGAGLPDGRGAERGRQPVEGARSRHPAADEPVLPQPVGEEAVPPRRPAGSPGVDAPGGEAGGPPRTTARTRPPAGHPRTSGPRSSSAGTGGDARVSSCTPARRSPRAPRSPRRRTGRPAVAGRTGRPGSGWSARTSGSPS